MALHAVSRNRIRRNLLHLFSADPPTGYIPESTKYMSAMAYGVVGSRTVEVGATSRATDIYSSGWRMGRRSIYLTIRPDRVTLMDYMYPEDDPRREILAIAREVLDGLPQWGRMNDHYYMRINVWRPTIDQLPVAVSTSMQTKLKEWIKERDPVSTMLYSTRNTIVDGELVTQHAIKDDLPANYLTIRDDGNISYLPKGKWADVANPWQRKTAGRQDARPAKLIRSLLTEEALKDLTPKDWELFASRIKGVAEAEKLDIRLVTGEDVRFWYGEDNYGRGAGDLNNSCMRYMKQQPYFDVYAQNPNQCALLIATRQDRLMARCLVWTTTTGVRIHDRIYGNEATRQALAEWLRDEGIRRVGVGDGVKFEHPWHRHYPYFDSMGHMDHTGTMWSYDDRSKNTIYVGGTGGGMDLRHGPPICPECGKHADWGSKSGPCQECRDRKKREARQAWVDRFTGEMPATISYADYCMIPGDLIVFRDNLIDIVDADKRVVATYEYHPDRSIYTNNDIFTLVEQPAMAAV